MNKKIKPGMWMMLYDEYSEGNIMVKVLKVDEGTKTATVYMDLAAKKTDEPVPYETEVPFENLMIPTIKVKKNKKHIEK